MPDKTKCKGSACKCQTDKPNGSCSDSCSQNKMTGGKCGCGHPTCK